MSLWSLLKPVRPQDVSALGRFHQMVDVKGSIYECWPWLGATSEGYGKFHYNGESIKAHRALYEILHGNSRRGLPVQRACGNRLCVNPWHLAKDENELVMVREMLKNAPTSSSQSSPVISPANVNAPTKELRKVILRFVRQ